MRRLRIGYGVGPRLGAHGAVFQKSTEGTSPCQVSIDTQAAGSSIVAFAFGYQPGYTFSTDNKGNSYTSQGAQGYSGGQWSGFGIEAFVKANAAGGSGHVVGFTKSAPTDESTLLVCEVVGATVKQASANVARAGAGAGVAYNSGDVVVTGPALLVCAWTGDSAGNVGSVAAYPGSGWSLLESLFLQNTSYVQAALAVRQVAAAGTYNCPWTPDINQGGAISIVAFQA